jgi:NAD(P)-dependent dehydrogenase (short-subunit alcohol dehydrogenase family)
VPNYQTAEAAIKARHPIGRLGRPDELGGGIVYLLSEEASFVTCSEFLIDGGFTQI